MTTIRILFKSRVAQLWALIFAGTLALISLGYQADLNKSEWSGWAQAVGAFVAIIASGRIAVSQSQRQFEDARRLQKLDSARQAHQVAKATSVIAYRVAEVLLHIIKQFKWDRTTFHDIAYGRIAFDRDWLTEMSADLDAIPLHEVPSSRLIAELLMMRSAVRQITAKIELGLKMHRDMNAEHFQKLFNTMDDAHLKIVMSAIEIESITKGIGSEIER